MERKRMICKRFMFLGIIVLVLYFCSEWYLVNGINFSNKVDADILVKIDLLLKKYGSIIPAILNPIGITLFLSGWIEKNN